MHPVILCRPDLVVSSVHEINGAKVAHPLELIVHSGLPIVLLQPARLLRGLCERRCERGVSRILEIAQGLVGIILKLAQHCRAVDGPIYLVRLHASHWANEFRRAALLLLDWEYGLRGNVRVRHANLILGRVVTVQ